MFKVLYSFEKCVCRVQCIFCLRDLMRGRLTSSTGVRNFTMRVVQRFEVRCSSLRSSFAAALPCAHGARPSSSACARSVLRDFPRVFRRGYSNPPSVSSAMNDLPAFRQTLPEAARRASRPAWSLSIRFTIVRAPDFSFSPSFSHCSPTCEDDPDRKE